MKKWLKIIVIVIVFVLLLVAGAVIFVKQMAKNAVPDYSQDIEMTGMIDEVIVYRDSDGIPHIFAKNEQDLYQTTGYLMAQDRLWQMDLLRRATLGRLSEIFGKDLAETDYLMRTLRIPQKSKMVLDSSDAKIKLAIHAFANGVNQYIQTHTDKLPIEFILLGYKPEAWKAEHSVNLIGYMAWDLTMAWNAEPVMHKLKTKLDEEKYKQLFPNLTAQKSFVFPDFSLQDSISAINHISPQNNKPEYIIKNAMLACTEKLHDLGLIVFSGSNNWAVSGKKSKTGKPILANDMHLGYFAPGIWSQIHQVIEGKLDVTGVILPGQPFVINGHNENIAWGMTNVMLDDMDFYEETINPDNPNQYKFNGQWKEMEVIKEKIQTNDSETITKEIKLTHRGPVISDIKGFDNKVISMRWTGYDYSNELRTIYLLNRAASWDDFTQALTTFSSISQNIVYADIEGNIGMYCAAGIPIREGSGLEIMPGETDQYDWQGFVPFEQLPHTYNPDCGYVSSANNKTVSDAYPFHISHWFDLSYRIDRIRQMLTETEKPGVDDFKAMQSDVKAIIAEKMTPTIIEEVNKKENLSEAEREAVKLLAEWDFVMDKNKPQPAIFETFYINYMENVIRDEMGDDIFKEFVKHKVLVRNIVNHTWQNRQSTWCDNVNTKDKTENFTDIVQESFEDALLKLDEKTGGKPQDWKWGDIHKLTIAHPMAKVKVLNWLFDLNSKTYPVSGSFHTVCPYAYSFANPFKAVHGASHRHIYSTADWNESLSIIPTGVSGVPLSKYYGNQTQRFVNNQYHQDLTDKQRIEDVAKFKIKVKKKE